MHLPFKPDSGRKQMIRVHREEFLGADGHEACYSYFPVHAGHFTGLKASENTTHVRVTRVRIQAEPATRDSTQVVAIGNATSKSKETSMGYSEVARQLRAAAKQIRSPVGGSLDVTWRVPGSRFIPITALEGLEYPGIWIAVISPDKLKTGVVAWFEITVWAETLSSGSV